MRWRGGRRSENVEDRRGMRVPVGMRFPGGTRGGGFRRGRVPVVGGGLGVVALLVVALLFGVDPSVFMGGGPAPAPYGGAPPQRSASQDELADFVSVVLADTEDTWQSLFSRMGGVYEEPTLVLFTGAVDSACGYAQAAIGPFYCPLDAKLYIDLAFYRDLRTRFEAPGDFAQAYVIAHEVGHHVQNLLGISDEVQSARRQLPEAEGNALSVRLELQADCFAGIWAHHAERQREVLEPGDVEEALAAAAAVGDDRIQARTRGTVVPDSFTHGTSEQRARWFLQGFENGDLQSCDTFGDDALAGRI